jgi:high-affinity Fe2+/Pb2+ permease
MEKRRRVIEGSVVPELSWLKLQRELNKMTQFLLFVMTILLILIFWELSKIHARLKKALRAEKESAKRRDETSNIKVA